MPDEVRKWLESIGLDKYGEVFSSNEIDFGALPLLSEGDLKDLGLSLGARRKLQAAVSQLRRQTGATAAQPPDSTPVAGEAERRQLTVMFCDLVGSTELSQELDPEELRDINRVYQDAAKAAIERFDGYVARYMGDGVLAYFGYPQAHEDDAERAVRAGLELTEAVAQLRTSTDLAVRVGIATGPVVVGDLIGEGASQESAVIGETPNLAARLQSNARPQSVVIGALTKQLIGSLFAFEDLGHRTLKGFAEPVQVWRVCGEVDTESRFEARHVSGLGDFVGRDQEIGLLLERWRQAQAGEGQVIVLSGEAGIGKSRMVEALRTRVANDDHVWVRYQCSPYHANSALYPFVVQLGHAARLRPEDSEEEKLEKLEVLLARGSEQVLAVMPHIAALLSIPAKDRYLAPEMSAQARKEKTFVALLEQLARLSLEAPLLIVYEDMHWMDPTTAELLELMVDRVQELRVLAIVTTRPGLVAPWSGHGHVTSLALNRLTHNQSISLIDSLTEGKHLHESVVEQIVTKTDGIPLFIEELTKAVLESDSSSGARRRSTSGDAAGGLSIPNTLQDSLMARLDRLGAVKDLAQVGSLIGREFGRKLLGSVTDLDETALDDALAQLLASQLVYRRGVPPTERYVFKHALVQDAAKESMLRAKRQTMHGRIATVLEREFGGATDTEPEVVAHHFTQAGLGERAMHYWLQAGERAKSQSANAEAINHLTQGLALLPRIEDSHERNQWEVKLHAAILPPLMSSGGYGSPEVEKHLARARELSASFSDRREFFPVLWQSWLFYLTRARHEKALALGEQLLEIGEELQDEELLLEAHLAVGGSRFYMGEPTRAHQHLSRVVDLYDADRHRSLAFRFGGIDPGAATLGYDAWTLWMLGYPQQARPSLPT